jgi:hypothetical protein
MIDSTWDVACQPWSLIWCVRRVAVIVTLGGGITGNQRIGSKPRGFSITDGPRFRPAVRSDGAKGSHLCVSAFVRAIA